MWIYPTVQRMRRVDGAADALRCGGDGGGDDGDAEPNGDGAGGDGAATPRDCQHPGHRCRCRRRSHRHDCHLDAPSERATQLWWRWR